MNELVKQFDAMAQMMTSMAGKGMRERMKMVRKLQSGMMQNPNGLARKKVGTGKRLTNAERAEAQKRARKGNAPPQTRAEAARQAEVRRTLRHPISNFNWRHKVAPPSYRERV